MVLDRKMGDTLFFESQTIYRTSKDSAAGERLQTRHAVGRNGLCV